MEMRQLISVDHIHPHDLIFCEKELMHLNGNEEIFCSACSKSLAGASFYSCGECYFFLHKTCAEFPLTIKHLSHRKHPLILLSNALDFSNQYYCDMCRLRITNFRYNCYDCDFDLHIDCAMLAQCFIQPESHKHHFTKWYKSDPFTCDSCGTYTEKYRTTINNELQPWICTQCHVLVHSECMSLPFTVYLPHHIHSFIHTYFIPETHQSIALICGICCQQVNREFGCYSCQSCLSVVHVNCARKFKVEKGGQKFWAEEIKAAADKLVEQEIEHFLHPNHKLFLVQNHDDHDHDHEIETKCDGCMRIISYPFYKCLECDFSLHILCSKLPKQINHPLHQEHPLTLAPSNHGFYCRPCLTLSQGFAYHCLTCTKFMIDVECALVNPFDFDHYSHKHPLSMFTQSNKYPQCTSCGGKGEVGSLDYMLRCKEQCPLALDYRCATLPRTIKYEYDEHFLILSYPEDGNSNLHHNSNEYPYCDICHQYRDPNLWFYACPNYSECPMYLHLKCAQVDYPYIKLGTRIKDSDFHEHELISTLRKEDSLPCDLCSEEDQEILKDQAIYLECYEEDCNFRVHLSCYLGGIAPSED